jgi:hypothetical protein
MTLQLQYFEVNVLGGYLMDAWQKELQTDADPIGGKWLTSGPGNGPGLLGGLVDELRTDLVFSNDKVTVNKTKEIATSTTLDNRRNEFKSGGATAELTWSITNTSTSTHSTTHSIKSGISERVKFEGNFLGVAGVSAETGISFDYSYSWTDTQGSTVSDTKTMRTSVKVDVPDGRVQKVVVLADRDDVALSYSAQVYLTGVSEANFASPVNGRSKWAADAGTICGWISKWGSAADDHMTFAADPTDAKRGIASLTGTMKARLSMNFTIYKIDVTDSFDGDPGSEKVLDQLANGRKPDGAEVIKPVVKPVASGGIR